LQEQSVVTRAVTVAGGVYAPGHLGELTQIVGFDLVDGDPAGLPGKIFSQISPKRVRRIRKGRPRSWVTGL
jgi:hypothetical protein